jgi:hypothetical protein
MWGDGGVPVPARPTHTIVLPHQIVMTAVLVVLLSQSLSPSFDSFLSQAVGQWRGASFCWEAKASQDGQTEMLPLSVAPGFVTTPTPSLTEVTEVMRSCGGAVQGVEEQRECQPAAGSVRLDRSVDGASFFSCGSWASAPAVLSNAEESDLLTSPDCFGLSVCIAHNDYSRRRLLAVVADKTLACCDVTVERFVGASLQKEEEDDDDDEAPDAVHALLNRRLQCVVEANAWDGGATMLTLAGEPPAGAWLNARVRWQTSEGLLDGGAPLVPKASDGEDVAYMPGGCWVRVGSASDEGGGTIVEVGSVCPEALEVKSMIHHYDAAGALSKVSLSKVTALE